MIRKEICSQEFQKHIFEKLRLSPFKTKENGISYFVNGYFMEVLKS